MDKKDGGPIDLESLRGFTPGPWEASYMTGESAVTSPCGRVLFLAAVESDECVNADAALIAAAPSMHAELTARRARDAEVEALVAAVKDMLAGWRYIRYRHGDLDGVGWDRAQDAVDAALAPFTGAKT